MRIIVNSDRMYGGNSAYSKDTFEICTRFAQAKHAVAHVPMGFANHMGKTVYRNVLIYGSSNDNPFNDDVAEQYYVDFKADLFITYKDPWVFHRIPSLALNYVPIVPIDHAPVSGQITSALRNAYKTVTISKFGQRELKKKGIESTYIPLGVRTDIFQPMPKAECKKSWYLNPDHFIVGIVAMNRARKMIVQQLRGYKRFIERNPDIKTNLFLWTNVMPQSSTTSTRGVADVGVHLLPEIYELGLGDYVNWVKWDDIERMGGIPDHDPNSQWDMNRLYNAFDVLLGATGGEGAGKPYLEANACGVPSIYTNYAAASEYAGSTGIPVNAENYVVITTPGTRYYLPDVDDIAEALEKAYKMDREKIAKRCRMFASKQSWDNIIKDYWLPFLDECAVDLKPHVTNRGVFAW